MVATLSDVAQHAGVSLATASRVINNSSHNVTDELRRRVLKAVAELHYVPNAHARALVQSSSSTVGVIVHDMSDPYFAEIARGIQRVATEAGKLLIICNSYRSAERELAYVDMLRAQKVEAIVIAGSGRNDRQFNTKMAQHIESFMQTGGRVAFIGRHHVAGNAVLPENLRGGQLVGEYLVEMGHQHIGVITGPGFLTTTEDRLQGFRNALLKAGLKLPADYIVEGDFSRDGGLNATQELLGRALPLTAIFALNDPMAIGAMAALRENGLSVPQDISIVGYDNIAVTIDVTPTLTTIDVPLENVGEQAMQLALAPHEAEIRVEYQPVRLVVRDSVRRLG
jgi:LacI family transcriptional regulator